MVSSSSSEGGGNLSPAGVTLLFHKMFPKTREDRFHTLEPAPAELRTDTWVQGCFARLEVFRGDVCLCGGWWA